MHEEAFINSILEPIEDKENVLRIEIELGDLVGITPEHLKKHLADKVNWEIKITVKESWVKCVCGYKGPAKIKKRLHDLVIFECPKCGNLPKVIDGKDIKIRKVIYG